MELPASVKLFYERVFMEKFIQAAGPESFDESFDRDICTAINPTVERLVSEAGTEAGLQYREYILRTGGF